jgi:integral membrane protein (TIGR01906 family)
MCSEGAVGFIRLIATVLFIIAVPTALVLTNIRIVTNEPRVYEYAIDEYDGPATTGIPRGELLRASNDLRRYFRDGRENIVVRVQNDRGETESLFNSRETQHLHDVKSVMRGAFRVQEVAVLFVCAYVVTTFIWARESSARGLAMQLLLASGVGLVAIAAIGAVAALGFDAFWERFHGVLFDNDLWQLDPERDHLIQMFPEDFWRDVVIWIGAATIGELLVLAGVSAAYLGLTRNRERVVYEDDARVAGGVRA